MELVTTDCFIIYEMNEDDFHNPVKGSVRPYYITKTNEHEQNGLCLCHNI